MYVHCSRFLIFFQKMTKLMDILSNPNKRLAYDVLLRCESVLEHMVILLGAFQIAVSAKRQNVFWPTVFRQKLIWQTVMRKHAPSTGTTPICSDCKVG